MMANCMFEGFLYYIFLVGVTLMACTKVYVDIADNRILYLTNT